MFVFSNLILLVARLVDVTLLAYLWILIARVVLSWVGADRFNPIVRFLYRVTEPVLRPIRQRLPDTMGLDLSPMIVGLAIYLLEPFLVNTLRDIALSMR